MALGPAVRELPPGQRPRDSANDTLAAEGLTHAPARDDAPAGGDASEPRDDSPSELAPLNAPQLYHMQLTTTEEHVQLVERARALGRERLDELETLPEAALIAGALLACDRPFSACLRAQKLPAKPT